MAKLKPKEKAYFAQFATAAHAAQEAAQKVDELSTETADRAAVAERLAALAEVADTAYRSVLTALRASFVTPFERTEIQALARGLDGVVRRLEGVASLVHLLDPAAIPDEFRAMTKLLAEAAGATEEAVGKLHKLKGLKHHHERITQLAAEAEFHRRLLLVRLTSGEVDPLGAIEMQAIAGEIHGAVTAFMDVAEALETVLITEG